jgi:hypothetical protein
MEWGRGEDLEELHLATDRLFPNLFCCPSLGIAKVRWFPLWVF